MCEDETLLSSKNTDHHNELAGWVYILHYLKQHDRNFRRQVVPHHFPGSGLAGSIDYQRMAYHDWLLCPQIEIMSCSWDFVPPDVTKPLARITVAALAITARRLGMSWKEFEPSTGSFQAEGTHQVITSTVIRGMGTLAQYNRDPLMDADHTAQTIIARASPILVADDMGFGRLGRAGIFNTTELEIQVGSMSDVVDTLPLLFSDNMNAEQVTGYLKGQSESANREWMSSAIDIVPFLTPFLGLSGSERPIIPWPNTCSRGLTYLAAGFRSFEECLIKHIDLQGTEPSTKARIVLGLYQSLLHELDGRLSSWESPATNFTTDLHTLGHGQSMKIFSVMREAEGLLNASPVVLAGKYTALIAQHLLVVCATPTPSANDVAERMRKLFACLGQMSRGVLAAWGQQNAIMDPKGEKLVSMPTVKDIEDAWLAMMLRAMCWQRLHIVMPGAGPLPGEFAESKFPVYLS